MRYVKMGGFGGEKSCKVDQNGRILDLAIIGAPLVRMAIVLLPGFIKAIQTLSISF